MIGSDAFYSVQPTAASREMDRLTGAIKTLLGSLKPEAARKVAYENAVRVYRLKER
jgi:predicted TIM-barrel fold metal-dependent hydrolase